MLNQSERIQKILSFAGVLSRRKAEEAITQGLVTINGKVVKELGAKANPYIDVISYQGEPVNVINKDRFIFALNKPREVISSTKDPYGRPTVLDYFKGFEKRLYPVGRLDYQTEGLILLTNDGSLANRLMHPKYGIQKTYLVKIKGSLTANLKERFLRGINLEDGRAKFVSLKEVKRLDDKTWYEVVVEEGRNRLVRRMFDRYGVLVDRLRRVQVGPVVLGRLPSGHVRELTQKEISQIYRLCGLDSKS